MHTRVDQIDLYSSEINAKKLLNQFGQVWFFVNIKVDQIDLINFDILSFVNDLNKIDLIHYVNFV